MIIQGHEEAYSDCGEMYRQKHEKIIYPEGFRERLEGRSIEEQMNMFAAIERVNISKYSYGSLDKEDMRKWRKPLNNISDFRGLVVENGIIEGILVHTQYGIVPMGPGDTLVTYSASDEDGTGSTEREDTVTFICLDADEEWK